ncbi:YlbE-like family protein [Pseudalkalibacillus caeni]|uniref:YlbE-like protein n=1 Tax=Exobacillus caeni TaxID=2574798 RepID=A0A5R9FDC8_9BACL|nr:YlbE-like family protein [Pseudalkalibacillus caeni]TLS37655.1 hypothetical protein FCL54_07455 [Pseudalkalibacillus caeni]
MRAELQQYLQFRRDLVLFLRNNPIWYRKLSRNPYLLSELEQESRVYYGQTFPQKIDKINNQMNMVNMLLQMLTAVKE